MYERCLNEAERILAGSKDIVLPIKQVWKDVLLEGKRRSFDVPPLIDFDALLEGDRRFELISTHRDEEESEENLSDDDVDSNLGTLGFYPQDKVKLRRIRLPKSASDEIGSTKGIDAEEDVEPLNVRGLSATKPVLGLGPKNRKIKTSKPPQKTRIGSNGKKPVGSKKTKSTKPARKSSAKYR
jgi:hypothetical protein